jgi:hypothetical protein
MVAVFLILQYWYAHTTTVKPLPYETLYQYLLRIGEIVILVSRTSDFNPEVERKFFFLSPKKASKSCRNQHI